LSNIATNTIYITVEDTTNPVISSPADILYDEGDTGNTLTWTITDLSTGTYTVYRNLTDITTTLTWTSGTPIELNIDGLSFGVYNFYIIARDEANNLAADNVIVTVIEVDTTDPVIDSPTDIEYVESVSGNVISWHATDINADTYTISRDGSQVQSDTWDSATPIDYNVDGLTEGVYEFTIEVFDSFGNSKSDTVIVTVTEAVATDDPKDDDDDGNGVVIVVVVVVALGAAGAGAFVYMKKK
jgi:hypothetical protein